jgi:Protein of unknown function (DUF1348)
MDELALEWNMQIQKSIHTNPPLPPFTHESAVLKVRLAEDAWNSRDPERVALAYTPNSQWRNRSEFVNGGREIVAFLTRKWAKELEPIVAGRRNDSKNVSFDAVIIFELFMLRLQLWSCNK